MEDRPCVYKRALIKLSGEALGGDGGIFDDAKLKSICRQLKRVHDAGVETAIVIGAGNIWRGARQGGLGIDRVRGDHMGMPATLINSLALEDYLIKCGVDTVVMSAIPMSQICPEYSQYEADAALRGGKAVIIACGVGYPFLSTDTGMVLRAAELGADIVLSAKSVDYVYDKDPKLFPDARKYERLTYSELMARDLKAIDGAAGALARENGLKIMLFSLSDPENIYRAAVGEQVGTLLEN